MKDKKEDDHSSSSSSTSIPTCVIKVNINCCKSCPVKAKKGLLKLTGVDSVVVDPEKRLVYVTGKVDPLELTKKFAKWGKKAQILTYDKESINEEDHVKGEFKKAQVRNQKNNSNSHRKEIHDDYCSHSDFGHEPEKYVPPKELDISNICRDPYCKIHVRNNVIKTGPPLVPRHSGATMMWHHRLQHPNHFFHGGVGGYPPPGIPYPGFGYSRMPPYEQYYPRIAPPAIEYYNMRRPMRGFDNFSNYFNEENSRNCSIM